MNWYFSQGSFTPPTIPFDHLIGDRELGIVERIFVLRRSRAMSMANVNSIARVARRMHRAWPLCYVGIILPKAVRDPVYRFIARHRYRWFGKQEACMIPTPELRARFMESE